MDDWGYIPESCRKFPFATTCRQDLRVHQASYPIDIVGSSSESEITETQSYHSSSLLNTFMA
jgi:hypothetical protein